MARRASFLRWLSSSAVGVVPAADVGVGVGMSVVSAGGAATSLWWVVVRALLPRPLLLLHDPQSLEEPSRSLVQALCGLHAAAVARSVCSHGEHGGLLRCPGCHRRRLARCGPRPPLSTSSSPLSTSSTDMPAA